MHTGFTPVPSFPRPSLGSLVASQSADHGLPRYVTLGEAAFGAAFLGSQHGPFVIGDLEAAKAQLDHVNSRRQAIELLSEMNRRHANRHDAASLHQRTGEIESVRKLLKTPFSDALDVSFDTGGDRDRYGDHPLADRMRVAHRMLRLGVPFVEVQFGGWDTHVDNGRRTERLCRELEQPWLALMDDLQSSGLWDDTLLVWMGEFGRTPTINAGGGRDHYPETTPVVLAGGNLGGTTVGRTSDDGARRLDARHSVADLMSTVLTLTGFDIEQTLTTDFDSPTTVTDGGTPIAEIVDRA